MSKLKLIIFNPDALMQLRGSCLDSLDGSYTSGTAFVTYFVLNHQVFVVYLLTKECIKVIMRTILCVTGFVIMLPICEHGSFLSRSRMMLSLLSSLLVVIHDMNNLLLLTKKSVVVVRDFWQLFLCQSLHLFYIHSYLRSKVYPQV